MEVDENILDEYEEDISEADVKPVVQVSKEVSLDAFSDVAEKDKFFKVSKATPIKEGLVLTISEVKPGRPAMFDKKGKDLVETNSKGNKYYKGRLEIRFKEEIEGMKIREFLPGLFYSVKDGKVADLPTIPRASDQLEDPFTNTLAKVRYLYCTAKNVEPKDVSDKAFLKGLIGMRVKVKRIDGKNPKEDNKEYSKLQIIGFVI